MIIRSRDEIAGTGCELDNEHFHSFRLLYKPDGMGFSMTDTYVRPGPGTVLWYKNHLEACYCVEGEGTVEDLATGEVHKLVPGTLYCLDKHDRHHIRSETGMRLICTFNPPLTGDERHDADGSFGPSAD